MASLLRWLPLALLAVVAFWLRTHDLALRPMHADEANQAVKTGELLETGRYAFDPHDHHGPTLYYLALPIAWLRGERTLAALTESTVRLVPALFGTLAVVLLYLLAMTPAGRASARTFANPGATISPPLPETDSPPTPAPAAVALAAAGFLALSPPAVYYSRFFIQETLLLAFTLATFLAARRWWQTRALPPAIALGVFAGLMQATKSTAPLFLLAGALACLAGGRTSARSSHSTLPPSRGNGPKPTLPPLAAVLLAFLLTAGLFYSSFLTHPRGLLDAFTTYAHTFSRLGADTGHEKNFSYFLRLFAWQRDGGLVWHQLPFTALALVGFVTAFAIRSSLPLLRWAAFYTAFVALALSVPAYKTPWHAIHLVPGLALLAAGALAALTRLPQGKLIAIPAAILVAGTLYRQTAHAAFHRSSDWRNPYAYVHTSPDILKLRPLALAALARAPDAPIRVIAEEYWPIPWYLRGLPAGYWSVPPADCDGALVIASVAHAETVRARLDARYEESLLGLRPGVMLVVFAPEKGTTNGPK